MLALAACDGFAPGVDSAGAIGVSGTPRAERLSVCADGDYADVQTALEAVATGGVVEVCAGRYGPALVYRDVTLRAEGAVFVGDADHAALTVAADAVVDGVTLEGHTQGYGVGALWIVAGSSTLSAITVTGGTGATNSGHAGASTVEVSGGSTTIDGLVVEGNEPDASLLSLGGDVVLRHAVVRAQGDTSVILGPGADVANSVFVGVAATAEGTVANSVFDGAGLVPTVVAATGDFRNNVVTGCVSCATLGEGADYDVVSGTWEGGGENVRQADPGLDPDYALLAASPCIDAGDPAEAFRDPDGTRNDVGAFGGPDALAGAL